MFPENFQSPIHWIKTAFIYTTWLFCLADSQRDTIHLPILISFTNDGPRNGIGCKTASEIAVSSFRNQSNALNEKYNIEPVFLDERGGSGYALQALVRFTFEDKYKLAPMVVGPFFTPGCIAIANSLHYFNMVQIAMSCGSPSMTNKRSKYPNFYRVRSPGDIGIFPTLKYMKEIGKWDTIAVITTITNSYNLAITKKFLKVAADINITVGHFDFVQNIDQQTIERLKDSELRVVAIEIGQPGWILDFLCLSYKNGLTGPRYAFFLFLTGFSHPDGLPERTSQGCSKEEIIEQYRYSHFVNAQQEPITNDIQSTSGLTATQFEDLYNEMLDNHDPSDTIKRFQCFDSVAKALYSLKDAEEKLMEMDKTLKDFLENPGFIMNMVNSSVATTDIFSLRTGVPLQYSKRMELDTDPQVVVHWREGEGLVVAYTCRMNDTTGDPGNILEYQLFKKNEIDWFTIDGQPPAQMAAREIVIVHVNSSTFLAIIIITGISTLIEIVLSIVFFYKKTIDKTSIILVTTSVLMLNIAAIVFAWKSPILSLCYVQPYFIIFALSICNFLFTLKSRSNEYFERIFFTVITVVIPLVLVILWFTVDTVSLVENVSPEKYYDEIKDIKYIYKRFTCRTLNFGYTHWALLIAGYQLLIWLYFLNDIHWKIKSNKRCSALRWKGAIDSNVEQSGQNKQHSSRRTTRTSSVVIGVNIEPTAKTSLKNRRILLINQLTLTIAAIMIASTLQGIESILTAISITIVLLSWMTFGCLLVTSMFQKEATR